MDALFFFLLIGRQSLLPFLQFCVVGDAPLQPRGRLGRVGLVELHFVLQSFGLLLQLLGAVLDDHQAGVHQRQLLFALGIMLALVGVAGQQGTVLALLLPVSGALFDFGF